MGQSERLLGIDAGGTYTDAVLVNPQNEAVTHKAKALTTPYDLSVGIGNALDLLISKEKTKISLVSVSTTLATNSIVEGHGGRVGLILIGYDHDLISRNSLDTRLPVEAFYSIDGGHDVKGEAVHPLDIGAAEQVIKALYPRVDAFAVSGYFSVLNPEHEILVREIIQRHGGKPVVCGYELTNQLDAIKRVTTVVLNARLLPVIGRLLDGINTELSKRNIHAPLMVLKGDGSMFDERCARLRPVETVLSGPAASAIGAHHLAQLDNAIVVDMGGTTTDIANLEDGLPWTNPAGAVIGGWQTCVRAADLRSIGLGGDSQISIDHWGKISIGPRRAVPFFRLGEDHPEIVHELEAAYHAGVGERHIRPVEFLVMVRQVEDQNLSRPELELLRLLEEAPKSLASLEKKLNTAAIDTKNLEASGILRRSSLTPTDILWAELDEIGGNCAAARAGARLFAQYLGISVPELTNRIVNQIVNALTAEILNKLIHDETQHDFLPAPQPWSQIFDQALDHSRFKAIDLHFGLKKPIIAIGAPVGAFLPLAAEKLHTDLIIPPHAEVGNAVGTTFALVRQSVEVLVQPLVQGSGTVSYLIHSGVGKEEGYSLARAVKRAEALAAELARQAAYKAGARDVEVKLERRTVNMGKMAEVTVRATAQGKPKARTHKSS
jgi:N-methylhydantoinase A/oxoprolinase/acetone carboxylase beta subunit